MSTLNIHAFGVHKDCEGYPIPPSRGTSVKYHLSHFATLTCENIHKADILIVDLFPTWERINLLSKLQDVGPEVNALSHSINSFLAKKGVLYVYIESLLKITYALYDDTVKLKKNELAMRLISLFMQPKCSVLSRAVTPLSTDNLALADGDSRIYREEWDSIKSLLVGKASIATEQLHGSIEIDLLGGNRSACVGCHQACGGGHVVYIPSLREEVATNAVAKPKRLNFLSALASMAWRLRSGDAAVPNWVRAYALPQESVHHDQINRLSRELDEFQQAIKTKIGAEQTQIDSLRELLTLVHGQGDPLQGMVIRIFTKLGFRFIPNQNNATNEEDALFAYGSHRLIVEIKGQAGSFKLKDLKQVRHWREENIDTNNPPKAILLINTYCNKAICDRDTKDDIPDNVSKFAKSKGVCLLTSLQFLGLYIESLRAPQRQSELIEELIACNGRYTRFLVWQEFLSRSTAAVSTGPKDAL